MPVVNNVLSLVLVVVLLAAAIILFAIGQPEAAAACLALVVGAQFVPHPITKPSDK